MANVVVLLPNGVQSTTQTIAGFINTVDDPEIVAAINAATFNPYASISPTNGKVMHAGQQYFVSGVLYEAVANNVVLRNLTALPWEVVTAATKTIAPGGRYVANNAAQITFTIPASFPETAMFSIVGKGAGGWLIAQQAGQSVKMSGNSTTTGTGGGISSNTMYDCVDILNITADTVFVIRNAQGSLNIT